MSEEKILVFFEPKPFWFRVFKSSLYLFTTLIVAGLVGTILHSGNNSNWKLVTFILIGIFLLGTIDIIRSDFTLIYKVVIAGDEIIFLFSKNGHDHDLIVKRNDVMISLEPYKKNGTQLLVTRKSTGEKLLRQKGNEYWTRAVFQKIQNELIYSK